VYCSFSLQRDWKLRVFDPLVGSAELLTASLFQLRPRFPLAEPACPYGRTD